jgi:tetratricopeptide (TPR) repeat protein
LVRLAVIAFFLAACSASDGASRSPSEDWREAKHRLTSSRQLGADIWLYDFWLQIDPSSPEGREARRRIREADAHYREGIRRLSDPSAGDPRDSFRRALELAPMDPEHYLPLARACRDRDLLTRAKEYYRKYLLTRPDGLGASDAAAELAALPADPLDAIEAPAEPVAAAEEPAGFEIPVAIGAALLVLAILSALFLLRRRGMTLASLAAESPELHPAIAYLVGSLRHELLKHRIAAVTDAIGAVETGRHSSAELDFVRTRLFGGEPLASAWQGHVATFERALGYRLDLARDRSFKRAGRAIRRIAAVERELGSSRYGPALRRIGKDHAYLREFDASLATLVRGLVRTAIDERFLRGIYDEVRTEYVPSRIELDRVEIRGPDEAVEVEVFRVDLVLILKNIVRNAIVAVGRAPAPRAIGIWVEIAVELTGEEIVRISIADSSTESLDTQAIYDRRVDRGLGLVTAALTRYDGAISVDEGVEPYRKAVSVRLFRALDAIE